MRIFAGDSTKGGDFVPSGTPMAESGIAPKGAQEPDFHSGISSTEARRSNKIAGQVTSLPRLNGLPVSGSHHAARVSE